VSEVSSVQSLRVESQHRFFISLAVFPSRRVATATITAVALLTVTSFESRCLPLDAEHVLMQSASQRLEKWGEAAAAGARGTTTLLD
jgi:hypothetical protein